MKLTDNPQDFGINPSPKIDGSKPALLLPRGFETLFSTISGYTSLGFVGVSLDHLSSISHNTSQKH